MKKFIGRKEELQELKDFLKTPERRLISLIGRRGVGKTRLKEEFKRKYVEDNQLKNKENATYFLIEFRGKKNQTEKQLIKNCLSDLEIFFNKDLTQEKQNREKEINNWHEFFLFCDDLLSSINKKVVFIIDEFAWLHTKGSGFVDEFAEFYDKLMIKDILFIISGSSVSWMNKNVIKTSGGLHGRTHRTLKLKAFNLEETKEYLSEKGITHFIDVVNYYFYTGGVVRYLEKIDGSRNLLENVKYIYENGNNVSNSEFEELFYSIFEGKAKIHRQILMEFKKGNSKTKVELSESLKIPYNTVSAALDDLVVSNILSCKEHYGNEKKGKVYFLTDLFCYFYIKMLDGKIINYSILDNQQLKGFAFEILVFLNIELFKKHISRAGFESKAYSWQNKNAQIDLILDYGKEKFSLIEVKFYNKILDIDEKITNDIINKKDEFLNQIKKVHKEMDVIFISLLGTNNKDRRINYIDISLKEIFEQL